MNLKIGCIGDDVKRIQQALHLMDDGIFGRLTDEAVREFQAANGLAVDGIVGPRTWEKLGFSGGLSTITRSIRKIDLIIVHCSATREGRDYTVEDIRRWHLANLWSDIGYHYVIYRDGTVHKGRDVNISGAHCQNKNSTSIGICYIGGCDVNGRSKDTRTDAQKAALIKLLKELKKIYPDAEIHSHRDFANKDCPCFDATKEYAGL